MTAPAPLDSMDIAPGSLRPFHAPTSTMVVPMSTDKSFAPELEHLIGRQVVVDTKGPFVYIGTLERMDASSVLLSDVDVHNTAESNTSNDLYLIEARKYGVRANRKSAYVLVRDIVSLSPLTDIILF